MNSVLEIMKATQFVRFVRCENGHLWYDCLHDASTDKHDDVYPIFQFAIPFSDLDGAVFPDQDDKPMLYMRWIRKQFEADRAEREMIAKAKEDWEHEQKLLQSGAEGQEIAEEGE